MYLGLTAGSWGGVVPSGMTAALSLMSSDLASSAIAGVPAQIAAKTNSEAIALSEGFLKSNVGITTSSIDAFVS
jgi:hypothetical protein